MDLRDFSSYDWFTISLILIGTSFIVLKSINIRKYNLLLKLAYSNDYFKLKDKEPQFFTSFENVIFLLAHFILAQYVYFLIQDLETVSSIEIYPVFKVFSIFLSFLFLSFTKFQLEKLVNRCITDSIKLKYYIYCKQIIWSYSVFLGIPFLIFIIYNPLGNRTIFILSTVFMLGFYLLKILELIYKNRSLLIKNWYYFILYLCTLEIAPYFFLYKILDVN